MVTSERELYMLFLRDRATVLRHREEVALNQKIAADQWQTYIDMLDRMN